MKLKKCCGRFAGARCCPPLPELNRVCLGSRREEQGARDSTRTTIARHPVSGMGCDLKALRVYSIAQPQATPQPAPALCFLFKATNSMRMLGVILRPAVFGRVRQSFKDDSTCLTIHQLLHWDALEINVQNMRLRACGHGQLGSCHADPIGCQQCQGTRKQLRVALAFALRIQSK